MEEGEGRGFLKEVKEDDIYQKFGHLKFGHIFGQRDRQTDRQTERQTDRQTLWFIGKLHFQKSAD